MKNILVTLCVLGLSITMLGQSASRPSATDIPGHLDPHTGAFKPLPPASDGQAPAPSQSTGKIALTLTISLRQTYPQSETYSCGLSATVIEFTTGDLIFTDSNQVAATAPNNGYVYCTVIVPYSWDLTSPQSDSVSVSYSVTGSNGTTGLPLRTAQHGITGNLPIPANGTTTAYNLYTWF